MSKLIKGLKITSAMTLVVLLVGAYQVASAQAVPGASGKRAPSFTDTDLATPPPAVAKGHVLEKTYLHTGDYNANVPAGVFTPIDSKSTISCPRGPCTIFAHMLVENGEGSTTGNYSIILLYVDGSAVDSEYYVGITPSDATFINFTQDTQLNNLATGNHTVQMFYESFYGAFVAHYAVTYALYEP
jgi:hypothetical protein